MWVVWQHVGVGSKGVVWNLRRLFKSALALPSHVGQLFALLAILDFFYRLAFSFSFSFFWIFSPFLSAFKVGQVIIFILHQMSNYRVFFFFFFFLL